MEAVKRLFSFPPLMGCEGDGVAVCAVAVGERTNRQAVRQTAALASPPEPAGLRAERLGEHTVSVEHFNGGPGSRIDVVERFVLRALLH